MKRVIAEQIVDMVIDRMVNHYETGEDIDGISEHMRNQLYDKALKIAAGDSR